MTAGVHQIPGRDHRKSRRASNMAVCTRGFCLRPRRHGLHTLCKDHAYSSNLCDSMVQESYPCQSHRLDGIHTSVQCARHLHMCTSRDGNFPTCMSSGLHGAPKNGTCVHKTRDPAFCMCVERTRLTLTRLACCCVDVQTRPWPAAAAAATCRRQCGACGYGL